MNRLITNGVARNVPVVLGVLLTAMLGTTAVAGELCQDATAAVIWQDTLRSEIRAGAGRAVEETRDQVADELALRLLGERSGERLVAGTDTGKRG